MTLTLNGVDLLPMVAHGGITYNTVATYGANGGVLLNGKTVRDLIATKNSIVITCMPLTQEQMTVLRNAITGEYITGTITQADGTDLTTEYFVDPFTAGAFASFSDLWIGCTFTISER